MEGDTLISYLLDLIKHVQELEYIWKAYSLMLYICSKMAKLVIFYHVQLTILAWPVFDLM